MQVKVWAKAHGICDARANMLNSWSLVLMALFSLQTCVPPVLPPMWRLFHDTKVRSRHCRLVK